jgi:hypothetical protein
MATYAEGTSVPVEKSRAELEGLLAKAGAAQYGVFTDAEQGHAVVAFTIGPRGKPEQARQYRVRLPLPKIGDFKPGRLRRSPPPEKQWEQACRERWRALALCVKAKLVLIDLGVSSFEREFLADLVLVDGRTVHTAIANGVAESYLTGHSPALLLGPKGEG